MATALGCVRGNVIRGFASVEGGVLNKASDCKGTAAGWINHYKQDPNEPFSSGQHSVDFFVSLNAASNPTAYDAPNPCVKYSGKAPVVFCTPDGAQHAWPDYATAAIERFFGTLCGAGARAFGSGAVGGFVGWWMGRRHAFLGRARRGAHVQPALRVRDEHGAPVVQDQLDARHLLHFAAVVRWYLRGWRLVGGRGAESAGWKWRGDGARARGRRPGFVHRSWRSLGRRGLAALRAPDGHDDGKEVEPSHGGALCVRSDYGALQRG
jgi:hypothetical protein